MRADRKKKEKKQKTKVNAYKVLSVIYVVVLALFLVNLIRLSVLPILYLGIVVVVLAAITIPLVKSLRSKPKEVMGENGMPVPKKKTLSSVVAVIMIIVLAFGTFYMSGTLDFFGKISGNKQVHNFYVVVNADSDYEKLKDIKGETVGVMVQSSEAYTKAQEKLSKKAKVEFEKVGNYDALAGSLINDEYEAIFLNSAYYEMAIEEVDGFTTDTTRILEEITVVTSMEGGAKAVNVTKDSFNMYVSGIDTSGSIGNISRTDVNMIVTVNPKTRTVLLTSIPRDYYAKLGTIGEYDKLTHSGLYGIDETTATIEKLFGIDINYYARVNFTTVVNLVDALGGITVDSDYSFSARGQDGTVYSYNAGENYLGGEEALAFCRERKSFTEGDGQRIKNQQAVISGVINKVTGSTAILTRYNSILNAVESNFQTSLTQKDMTSLVKMQLGDMRGWDIRTQSVTGTGDMTPVYSIPHMSVYVMHPDQSSVVAATQAIQDVMDGK